MLDIAVLLHTLRFYVRDFTQPYSYIDEELTAYLNAAGSRLGLGDDLLYPTWADVPSQYEGIVIKLAYLNFLLARASTTVSSSDVKLEDFEVGSSSGDQLLKLLKELRGQIDLDLEALGLGMPFAELATVPRFDRETHTIVPYGFMLPPPTPILTITPTATGYSFTWTGYRERDFYGFELWYSTDLINWYIQHVNSDNHNLSTEINNLIPGTTYYFRARTRLNNTLYTDSVIHTVIVP